MSDSKDIQRMLTAASKGAVDAVRHFLESGVAVDAQDRHGNRAINHAAKAGHVDVVRLLLDHGANVNEPDGTGRTPLIACAEGDHTPLVELLLEAGADINGVGEDGRTALMECANSSSKSVAKRLLELGANVNAKRDDGSTALHEAIFCACEGYEQPDENDIIPLLLAAGADATLPDSEGLTPLALAQQYADEIDYTQLLTRSKQ
jgi:serine/threonine-protein phosphatase 6 regulatory ankyrin repeat subunit B